MTTPATTSGPDLRYPIGRFQPTASAAERPAHVDAIAGMPAAMRAAVDGLSPAQLDTPYREGGWTVRQLVHHVADSHMNAYIRFKLALTENAPTIKPYDEAEWAKLPDAREEIDASLTLLDALHVRWVSTLRGMSPRDFERTYMHPENGETPLHRALGLYAWHSRHHVAHVTALRGRQGW